MLGTSLQAKIQGSLASDAELMAELNAMASVGCMVLSVPVPSFSPSGQASWSEGLPSSMWHHLLQRAEQRVGRVQRDRKGRVFDAHGVCR